MTETTTAKANLFADATAAALNLKNVKAGNKIAANEAMVASALAAYAAVGSNATSAKKLAESNKAASAGYGSTAAVIYHAATGHVLSLPVAKDEDGNDLVLSAQSIQTAVRKVTQRAGGSEAAKAIFRKAKTQSHAVDLFVAEAANYTEAIDMAKVLQQALDLVASVEAERLLGNALPTEAEAIVATLTASLAVISATDEDDEDEDDQPESDEQIDPALIFSIPSN